MISFTNYPAEDIDAIQRKRNFVDVVCNVDFGIVYRPLDHYDREITSIHVPWMGTFILNGDHREAYHQLWPLGLEACLDYFKDHIAQAAHYSDAPQGCTLPPRW